MDRERVGRVAYETWMASATAFPPCQQPWRLLVCARNLWITPGGWDTLPEQMRESWRMVGEAAHRCAATKGSAG